MKIIILAGGGGTRLWPLSRQCKPKQFCRVIGNKTMIEQTVDRFKLAFADRDIYICLNEDLKPLARSLLPGFPEENFIIEPSKRDTGPAMGFVATKLSLEFPDEPIAFVPADHFIGNTKNFLKIFKRCDDLIKQTGKMMDIAIEPSFPSTVLGYTRIGELIEDNDGIEIHEFAGHTEKPEFSLAKKYLEAGDYLWHAGYYMWTPRKILEAFEKYSPEHYTHLRQIADHLEAGDEQGASESFANMEKISFDYAVTEKMDSSQVMIVKGYFGWSDVGAFDVLYENQREQSDADNNIVFGNWRGEDTGNCLIYGNDDDLIATVGVDDLVIVRDGKVFLVCPKHRAQEVKKIVAQLKQEENNKYL